MLDAADKLRRFIGADPALTQEKFAKRIDASQASVSAWIGRRKRPMLKHAFAIEDLTGIKAAAWAKVELVVPTKRAA